MSDGASQQGGTYDRAFYDALREGSCRSARVVWPLVLELLAPRAPRSIVDVGCGDGAWLAEALRALPGCEILGVDGAHVRAACPLLIPDERFVPCDLAAGVGALNRLVSRRFDVALSLEVAEHLPIEVADDFVAALVRLAPVVLFSAAIPGQGGEHHVNEAWPEAWVKRFAANGFRAVDEVRFRVWGDEQVEFWYKQNLLLFASDEGLEGRPALAALAEETARRGVPGVVHPKLLQNYGGELDALKKAHASRSTGSRRLAKILQRIRDVVRGRGGH